MCEINQRRTIPIKAVRYSLISVALLVVALVSAGFFFRYASLFAIPAILAAPFGLASALLGRLRGEEGVLRHLGVWGNALLLPVSLFALMWYLLFTLFWGDA
ncbi:hypothetical protein ACTID9_25085 [Brevibacillus fluminis]|uniref:hypothetical protein n=1 Tax=Brevibacillus fluminis TaxID=511487 RepID=UPI003F8C245B